MSYLLPIFIIVLGLGGLGVIVYRKLPQLATLDVDNLPIEKEARKKKEIMLKRIEAEGKAARERWAKRFSPLRKLWGKVQLQFRVYVGRIEKLLRHQQKQKIALETPPTPAPEKENKALESIREAEQFLAGGDNDRAEEAFIAAIKYDPGSAAAYRGLGSTYMAKGQFKEARETFAFVLEQLEPENDSVMVRLAEIAEAEGDTQTAINYYQQAVIVNDALSPRFYHLGELLLKIGEPHSAKEAALSAVELEPKNPKYLDLLIETGILCGDKNLAIEAYQELRLVNPDNQKLKSFKDRIYSLPPKN